MKYFVLVSGDLDDTHGTKESAERNMTKLMEDEGVDEGDIMLIYGEEIEFKLRAFIPEPASK